VNPSNHPSTPAAAGTAPGCFNNTLCHGQDAAPHALGDTWRNPTSAAFHGLEAKKNLAACQSCHGTAGTTLFDGGSASTKCSAAGCHATAKAHPATWYPAPVTTFPGYVASHRDSTNQSTACAICHDYTLGRAAPDNTAPSCFSASRANAEHAAVTCHANGPGLANHAVPYLDTAHTAVAQAGFDSNCAACHAVTGTSPLSLAPLCTVCHAAGSPLAMGSCTSCHARPPAGTAFPDAAGVHAKHNALSGVAGVCGSCHDTYDTGSQAHYDHANARSGMNSLRVEPGETKFLATYNAKSGTASFSATNYTCSNVSCHGGLAAPSWRTGTIDVSVDAGCRQCHALGTALGTPQNNSPYSGLHSFHLGSTVNALCTDCHNMANGTTGATSHFLYLNTSQMEGPAGQTVAPMGVAANYTAQGQTCGTFTCHNTLHSGFSWSGGANHTVPFLDAAHTAVTQSGFDSGCAVCHAVTGASPLSTAPICTVCHAAGSPLAMGSCTSCHSRPPAGTAFPDAAGVHAKHNALAGVTGICSACHNGYDTGSQAHYDHANARPGKNSLRVSPGETAFLSAYNAKTGSASFSATALSCSNVSCHGGQTTPSWATGTITVNSQCTSCHAYGTTQYNSYNSGDHNNSNHSSRACTVCHNTTTLAANHFTSLGTTAMEGPASATIGGGSTNISSGNYVPSSRSCTPSCHGTETW